MKMLWRVKVISGEGYERNGWIAADNLLQALRMEMIEGDLVVDEPMDWEDESRNQEFWKAN